MHLNVKNYILKIKFIVIYIWFVLIYRVVSLSFFSFPSLFSSFVKLTRISGCPFILALSEGFGRPSAPNWGPSAPTWGPAAPDRDGDGSTMSQTTYVPKFSFLHWIKRCKEPSCPRSPGLVFWRTLEVPDWGFGSWSWCKCVSPDLKIS